MAHYQGLGIAATGDISSATASLLSFADSKRDVIINNRSGVIAYFKFNDAATPIVSATVYDLVLSDATSAAVEDCEMTTIGVFVAATSGIRVVGFD